MIALKRLDIKCKPLGQEERLMASYLLTNMERRMLERGEYGGIVAFVGELPVGVLLYRLHGRFLQIMQVYVSGGYRRSGVGTELVETLHQLGHRKKLSLTASFEAAGSTDGVYRFFSSFRQFAIRQTEGMKAYLSQETIAELSKKYQKTDGSTVRSFFEQSKKVQHELCLELQRGFPAVAWELEQDNGSYRRDLCSCIADKGRVQAVCLIKEIEGELELSLLYTNAKNGVLGAKVLLDAIGSLAVKQPMPLWVSPVNETAVKILQQICPQYEIRKLYYTVCDMGKA